MPRRKETRGRPPKEDMTIREQKFLDLWVNKGMSLAGAYLKLYPESNKNTAYKKASELRRKLRERDGYKRILEAAGIGEDKLARKHAELLDAKKPIYARVGDKYQKVAEVPDNPTQMQALKHANELLGNMPRSKTELTGNGGSEIQVSIQLVDDDE